MYYIGIGASAGGQNALCEFFDHLDPELNAAYFITTHLSRTYRSYLDEILQRHTLMSVLRVAHKVKIKQKVIYVQPENASLLFDNGYVSTKIRDEFETGNWTIDMTLESLSLNFGRDAIGIILSGMGTDGTNGIRKIFSNGGVVLAQNSGSTEFNQMPHSAANVDFPVTVGRPSELADMIREIISMRLPPSSL